MTLSPPQSRGHPGACAVSGLGLIEMDTRTVYALSVTEHASMIARFADGGRDRNAGQPAVLAEDDRIGAMLETIRGE